MLSQNYIFSAFICLLQTVLHAKNIFLCRPGESRTAEIRWFFLSALRASWLLLGLTLQYDIIYAPELHNSVLNFSSFSGRKVDGGGASVGKGEGGGGEEVTVEPDWRERPHPSAGALGRRSCLPGLVAPLAFAPRTPSPFPSALSPFPQLC